MAQNGGEQQALSKVLEAADKATAVHHPREVDNFTRRAEATADACDELSRYCAEFSKHLRKASADFSADVQQMLGRIRG
jgi:hypothetical protein